MLSKNNKYGRQLKESNKQNKYAFRKLATGFASVAIASMFYFNGTMLASADTTTPTTDSTTTPVQPADEQASAASADAVADPTVAAEDDTSATTTTFSVPTNNESNVTPAMLAESKAATHPTYENPAYGLVSTDNGTLNKLQSFPQDIIKGVSASYDATDDLVAWKIHLANNHQNAKYQAILFGNEGQTPVAVYMADVNTLAEGDASGNKATVNRNGGGVTGFVNGESSTGLANQTDVITIFAKPDPGVHDITLNHIRVATSNSYITDISVNKMLSGMKGQYNWDDYSKKVTVPASEIQRVAEETKPQADKYDPAAETLEVKQNAPVSEADVTSKVTGIPADATVTVDDPTTLTTISATPGKATVPVTVTYTDGSKDSLVVPVKVVPTPENEVNNPTADTLTKNKGDQVTVAEVTGKVKNIPDNAKVTIDDRTMLGNVTETTGNKEVPVTVTYADGTTDHLVVPITVNAAPVDLSATAPNYRYVWDNEPIQHPFVVADYNPDATIDDAYPITASNEVLTDADIQNSNKLWTGLTYTAENGKVVVSGNLTSPIFSQHTDQYTTYTIVESDGTKYGTNKDGSTVLVGVLQQDNVELTKGYGQDRKSVV